MHHFFAAQIIKEAEKAVSINRGNDQLSRRSHELLDRPKEKPRVFEVLDDFTGYDHIVLAPTNLRVTKVLHIFDVGLRETYFMEVVNAFGIGIDSDKRGRRRLDASMK